MFGTYLELLELLQDHVVGHVVEQPIGCGEDDVAELYVKGGAVCFVRAAGTDAIKSRILQFWSLICKNVVS